MKKIIIFITHSLGELDVILPMCAALKSKKKIRIEIFFAVDSFYYTFKKNDFYMYCAEHLDVKIHKFTLYSKFNIKNKKIYNNKLTRTISKLYFVLKSNFLLKHFISSDVYMHETSSQKHITNILYFFSILFRKKIFVYHHGQSINRTNKGLSKIDLAEKKLFLLFHQECSEWAKGIGYINQHIVGFPIFYKEWNSLMSQYFCTQKNNEKHILIFSRGVHKVYMDEDKYIKLLITSYEKIRKVFGNKKIIIRIHPREDLNLIKKIIINHNMSNIVISEEYSGLLSLNSICVISFWTSAILISLSLKIPSIEYYIEAKNFRSVEFPNGSEYRDPIFGIETTDDSEILESFLNRVKSKYYFNFDKTINYLNNQNLECFNIK